MTALDMIFRVLFLFLVKYDFDFLSKSDNHADDTGASPYAAGTVVDSAFCSSDFACYY